jgi:DNA polymerase sigma
MIIQATQTDDFLAEITRVVRGKYSFINPSLYFHGSRSDGTNYSASDVDVTVVTTNDIWHPHIRTDFRNLELDLPVALDVSVFTRVRVPS